MSGADVDIGALSLDAGAAKKVPVFNAEDAAKAISKTPNGFKSKDGLKKKLKPTKTDPQGYGRLPHAVDAGGIGPEDPKQIEEQRKIIWDFVKTVGSQIFEGANLVNMSMPVELFEPVSVLQRMVNPWRMAPHFLTRAAYCTDAVERMKNVMCFVVAGMLHNMALRKPFNPILGETYEGEFADGTAVYLEQTSHHPPVSHWQLIGPQGLWQFHGSATWSASIRGNALKGEQAGVSVVEFADGVRVTFNVPSLWVRGIAWGDRVSEYYGMIVFEDKANNLRAELQMNPEAKGFIRSLFSRAPTVPSDYMRGSIYRVAEDDAEEKEELCTVHGSWQSCLLFDEDVYWDVHESEKYAMKCKPLEQSLPSDARHRADRLNLERGDMQAAAEYKTLLEEAQRYDRKLRAEGRKQRGE